MMDFEEQISEDKRLLEALEPAIIAQRVHIKSLEKTLRESKRILRRMELSRRDLKKDIIRVKQRKSSYPSQIRKYTLTHFGKIFDSIERQAMFTAMPSVLEGGAP